MTGSQRERDLVELLEDNGFVAMRAGGSGSGTKRELPDVLAGRPVEWSEPPGSGFFTESFAFEAKYRSKTPFYVQKEEANKLTTFANGFGATAMYAVRWNAKKSFAYGDTNWYFILPSVLEDAGQSFRIDYERMDEGHTVEKL